MLNETLEADRGYRKDMADAYDRGYAKGKADALPHWIPCSERMPEEREWLGTKRFGTTISEKVHITFENPKGERFTRFMSFQNGKLSNYDQNRIDVLYPGSRPIAWMPAPEAWKGEKK